MHLKFDAKAKAMEIMQTVHYKFKGWGKDVYDSDGNHLIDVENGKWTRYCGLPGSVVAIKNRMWAGGSSRVFNSALKLLVYTDGSAASTKALRFAAQLTLKLKAELTFAPAQAVIDDEMIAYARRYRRGVDAIYDEGLGESALGEQPAHEIGNLESDEKGIGLDTRRIKACDDDIAREPEHT